MKDKAIAIAFEFIKGAILFYFTQWLGFSKETASAGMGAYLAASIIPILQKK